MKRALQLGPVVVAGLVGGLVAGLVTACPAPVAAPGCVGVGCKTDDQPATPPRLFVDPPFGLGYDCVTIGCDGERRLLVENRGGGTIHLALARLSVDSSTDFHIRRADGGVLPSDEASVVAVTADTPLELLVRYTPTDGRDDEGAVWLDWYDGAVGYDAAVLTRAELPLSTRALGDVAAALGDQRLNFGFVPVGGYAVRDIVISNIGSGGVLSVGPVTLEDGTVVALGSVFVEGSASDTAGAGWGERFVNPGEAAHIPVVFRPNGERVFQGALFVQTNDGANPALRVDVAGTAVSTPAAAVSVAGLSASGPLDFQSLRIGNTRNIEFLVANHGGVPLIVQGAATGAGLSVFPAEPQTVAPLEAAAYVAVWSPTVGGEFVGSVVLTTNDPAQPTVVIAATGFANAPLLTSSPTAIDFGGLVQGWTSGAQTFSLSNAGSGELTVNTIAFEEGSSSQIRFAAVPALPIKLSPGDPPVEVSVFLEGSTLGTANAVVIVGSDSIDGGALGIGGTGGGTGQGADGIARLNVTGQIITCEQGCPVDNGTPSCGTGACEIGACDARFHDAVEGFGSGCECGEDFVNGSNGTRRDIDGQCDGLNIGPIGDDCASTREVRRSGTLHEDNDADLYFFRATDDSSCFSCDCGSDSFDVHIRLENAPSGMVVCARRADDGVGCGGENQRTCSSGEIRFDGGSQVFGNDDDSDITVWVEWGEGAPPQCGGYTLAVKGNGGF